MHVLLIEDDLQLGAAIRRAFELDGVESVWVRRLEDARPLMRQTMPTVIVLSLSSPEQSLALLESVRGSGNTIPVVVTTSREGIDDCIRALRLGANDFVAKPVKMPELLVRVRGLMDRAAEITAVPLRATALNQLMAAPSRR